MAKKEQRKKCDFCGGSGQLSFFKGASRFLLSTEECDVCAGTGYRLQSVSTERKISKPGKTKKGCLPKKKAKV